ncbi:hypothetical protein [Streptomyces sp. NPDC003032]
MSGKQEYTATLTDVSAGFSKATANADTVVLTSLVTDRRDRDRPILTELTSQGARNVAAQLIAAADEAEAAVRNRKT